MEKLAEEEAVEKVRATRWPAEASCHAAAGAVRRRTSRGVTPADDLHERPGGAGAPKNRQICHEGVI